MGEEVKSDFKCQTLLGIGGFKLWFSQMKWERWLKVQQVRSVRVLEPRWFLPALGNLTFVILAPLEPSTKANVSPASSVCHLFQPHGVFKHLIWFYISVFLFFFLCRSTWCDAHRTPYWPTVLWPCSLWPRTTRARGSAPPPTEWPPWQPARASLSWVGVK